LISLIFSLYFAALFRRQPFRLAECRLAISSMMMFRRFSLLAAAAALLIFQISYAIF